ncbi:MAG: amino acid permease [Solirubrobacteraceae bacterium]
MSRRRGVRVARPRITGTSDMPSADLATASQRPHPRRLGWLGTTALAIGGSNQSLFLVGALILTQGTAAVPLLFVGLLLSWAAAPGWTELILMWPDRVGGIAASCAEAFRPYSPVLANLTGVCYWWGWVPTCGLTAILSASALHTWYLPGVPVTLLASAIVAVFTAVNLCGIRWVTRVAIPLGFCSAGLAFISAVVPVLAGRVDWHHAASFSLTTPFHGVFGQITSAMAGLYLIGFAAPAFEAAACHVGETRDPARNVPRAMFASGAMASVYFIVLPVVWLGVLGRGGLGGQLMTTLGPTYAPLLGGAAKAAAIWFMVTNMFHGTLQPLAGAARTLSQLSDDGLLPRVLGRRNRNDAPWVAIVLTALMAIVLLQSGDPTWVIAAANLTYLIGIGLPSVAVWLLRRNAPEMPRLYRAPRGTIVLGVGAALVWTLSTILGFEQFGMPTVLAGLGLAYSGSVLYAWRVWRDRRASGEVRVSRSLHLKLTGAMLAVLALDGTGYILAVGHVPKGEPALITLLADIFVAVAMLTIAVGLVLPGMISHATREVARAARDLARGTVADLTRAMQALSIGDLEAAHARSESQPVKVRTRDEVGLLADSFNVMHVEVGRAARALDGAREGLRAAEATLERNLSQQAAVAKLGQLALETIDLGTLIEHAVSALHRVMGLDLAAVLQRVEDQSFFRVRAVAGLHDDERSPERVPSENEAIALALRARAPVHAPPGSCPLNGFRGPEHPGGLLMAIPDGDRAWGLLTMHSDAQREFATDEIDFVHAVGNVLAEAIQRLRSLAQVRRQALHDPLTGLPNRLLFEDHLALALAQARRRESAVAVLFLDLDHFKLINDSLGHRAGDDLLREVAARLDASLRSGDTVARFGGDEFVVLCTDVAGALEADDIAARLADALREPMRIGEIEHRLAVSIGISVAAGPERYAEDLIREADAAMYRAKERGRNRHETFDTDMRSRATDRLRLANDLAQALEHGELRVEYQPIVGLQDSVMQGAEALVRWRHPVRGEVSPGEFIAVAEESGAIVAIGEFVLREACAAAVNWRRACPPSQAPSVSVNISLRQVRHANLPDTVAAILAETGLPPSALHLEITESVLMQETDTSMRCLHDLKALGVTLVLDDFGTGYSSLAYVKRFPIDVLKIDRSFIADLEEDDKDATIVDAIICMARGLRLEVVAEGVETVTQAASLNELGCDLAQGWLYARAVSGAEIDGLLNRPLPAGRAGTAAVGGATPVAAPRAA